MTHPRLKKLQFIALLVLLLLFRLAFGLCSEFWYEDERQVYLIGLKHYTTHSWPYYGPDVTYQIQIPGALQGLLVSVPLFVLPIPESPFIVLNLLSFSSICLLAWYCAKRFPEIPRWFTWLWLMTAPWTLNFSTHIVNPSYVLPGAILFFLGFLETFPYTSRNLISARLANFMMGFALFWVMQLHMSWILMLPFAATSLFLQFRMRVGNRLKSVSFFLLGCAMTGSLLLPTFLKYGFREGLGGTGATAILNLNNLPKVLKPFEGVLPRFLSFASFEVARFLGGNLAKRWLFIQEDFWLTPVLLFLLVVGILQPLAMIIMWFRSSDERKDWRAMKYLTLVTVLLISASFMFSLKPPSSHTFYLTLPIAMVYSFYCWSSFLVRAAWRKFAVIFLIFGIIFHVGLGLYHFRHVSLYTGRSIPVSAIEKHNYRILGERRDGARY